MRRHDALIPLTHDHHHALVRARRLRRAAAGDDDKELHDAAADFLSFFDEHSVVHFREEEEVLFPRVIEHDDAPIDLITRVLVEHVKIHALVSRLRAEMDAGAPTKATAGAIGDALTAHIRLEEDEVFPAIERLVPDSELRQVTFAERRRTPPPRPGS